MDAVSLQVALEHALPKSSAARLYKQIFNGYMT